MAHDISEVILEPDILDDTGVSENDIEIFESEVLDVIKEDIPHLVFLIPGIRTNGMWTQDATDEEFTAGGREIIFKPIRGDERGGTGRLSSFHLVSRFGLASYRQSFIKQIDANLDDYPDSPVSIFAHSLGSSLFAEIVREVDDLMQKRDRSIENIVLLGSVCHRPNGAYLRSCSRRFINDVGVQDMWPFRASVVRPDKYSDVGLWGFRNSFPKLERYFHNDHATCTGREHLEQKLIPLLEFDEPVPLGIKGARPKRPENHYVYYKRGLWIMAAILLVVSLCVGVFFGLKLAALSLVLSLIVWVAALIYFE